MIKRQIDSLILKKFFKNKAVIVIGARQTGKTTLIKNILKSRKEKVLLFNGDETDTNDIFNTPTIIKLKNIIQDNKIIFFDEAQKINNIGIIIKLIVDNIKGVQVIASGSSSFELMNNLNEPLTGRKYEFHLFPLSFKELTDHFGPIDEKRELENRLVFGSYPEIVAKSGSEEHLKLLTGSYLYKDLLMLEDIKKPVLLEKIVKALAFQLGNEVIYSEIAKLVESDKKTVEKYIDLLEKTYIIFRLPALNRNVRNEIKKGKKIYFYDTGIRNAVISDFRPLAKRTDVGALWENYLISERVKLLNYNSIDRERYFWRTTQQQEIDYIEVQYEKYHAYEFKWNPLKKVSISKTFTKAYPENSFKVITQDNYDEFLIK
ncbi:MAG: ATP-binding protein [Candidatus Delongbacteria bacterium]|jgi:predicted AAA+ superfamily ATPase|nr:ATP-binding protein [Candidatus Delongbacteria bacterium]